MKVEIISTAPAAPQLTTRDMKSGDIGIMDSGEPYQGHILKTYDNFTLLENPSLTWSGDSGFRLTSILAKGTILKLTL